MLAPWLMPVIAARNCCSRAGSAYSVWKMPGPPDFTSFWGVPVRRASVRWPQNGYRRWFAISRMPPTYDGLRPVEEQVRLGRVGVAIAAAREEAERDQRVEEVARRARMQPQPAAQRVVLLGAARQLGEHAHLDGAQQRLGRPEGESVCRIFSGVGPSCIRSPREISARFERCAV